MKILRLDKVKLGDEPAIIRVTYKTTFNTAQRDAIKANLGYWKWADTDDFCLNDLLLDKFNRSSALSYILNGK